MKKAKMENGQKQKKEKGLVLGTKANLNTTENENNLHCLTGVEDVSCLFLVSHILALTHIPHGIQVHAELDFLPSFLPTSIQKCG